LETMRRQIPDLFDSQLCRSSEVYDLGP
jgi:hypothetical protein